MGVRKNTNTILVDVINAVTCEKYTIQISLAHEGSYGFTVALAINLGQENNEYFVNLLYYSRGKKA